MDPTGRGAPPPLDAPVVGLGDPEALARGWLIELLAARPLPEAPAVPVDRLAAEAPALCAAVVAALVSDAQLDRLREGGDLEALAAQAGRLAGAGAPADVVDALERLRSVVWAAIEGTAPAAPPAGLADRLAHVCALLARRSLAAPAAAASAPVPAAEGPGRIRVARGDDAPLWQAALGRQLADGRRFALLLVDLDAADRLRAADPAEADDAFAAAGRAVRACVRRGDVLAHEDDGRLWIIAAEAGRAGADFLAARVAGAVQGAAAPRGVPLTASVGVALYPDDGRDADALTGQAEESMFAARASGGPVGAWSAGTGEGGAWPGPRAVT